MSLNYDYIICLSGSKIKDYPKSVRAQQISQNPHLSDISALLQEDSENIDPIGLLVQLSYCAYDIKKQIVEPGYDGSFIVKHTGVDFEEQQLSPTKISKHQYNTQAIGFKDTLQKLNDFIYQKFIRESKSFCFMSFGDELMTKLIPQTAKQQQDLKLAPHFYQYFDISIEFKKHLPHAVQLYSIQDMLSYTNLKCKENSFEHVATSQCKSVVRLLNMLVTEGHQLLNPKMINTSFQSVVDNNDKRAVYIEQRQKKSKRNYIRGRSPSPFKNPTRGFFIRLRGLPHNSTEYEVYEFMRGIRLYKEDIAFNYDGEGKFTGEVYLRLNSENDKFEAMNFNLGELEKCYIEIFETNENEWNSAKLSQYQEKRDQYNLNSDPTNSQVDVSEEQGIIKLKGLSAKTTEQDIIQFFVGLQISQIRRAIIGGKAGSECFVVFKAKQDAHLSLTYHMEKLNNRFVEIYLSTRTDFQNYMEHNFVNSGPQYSKDNMPVVSREKQRSTLMVTGLPFTVTKQQILDFFIEYELKERDIFLLNSHSGRFSGNSIVTFEDELESQRALKQKNFSYMGARYIELFQYKQ